MDRIRRFGPTSPLALAPSLLLLIGCAPRPSRVPDSTPSSAATAPPGGGPLLGAGPRAEAPADDRPSIAGGVIDGAQPPPALPAGVYKKIEVAAWSPVLGPRDALVTLVLFSDFQCPFCARVEPTLRQLRERYGDRVRVVWRNLPLPFHQDAVPAALAAMAAHAQGRFWPYHDRLLAEPESLDEESLRRHATALGLDLPRFDADRAGDGLKEQLIADLQHARSHDVKGTPSSFINGRALIGAQPLGAFAEAIDHELARARAVLARGVALPDLYATIVRELTETPSGPPGGRGDDDGDEAPTRPVEVRIPADAPEAGPKSAPVTLVEFSDFQCPFCGRAARTVSALQRKYRGRLRVVYMHQPLSFHPFAQVAAEASMAAHAQGKFWRYHDRLLDNQDSLTREDLERYAEDVELDLPRFRRALDEHTYAARVHADSDEGTRLKARGTPTFFINGVRLVGAQPPERFEAIIDQELASQPPVAAVPGSHPPRPKALKLRGKHGNRR